MSVSEDPYSRGGGDAATSCVEDLHELLSETGNGGVRMILPDLAGAIWSRTLFGSLVRVVKIPFSTA